MVLPNRASSFVVTAMVLAAAGCNVHFDPDSVPGAPGGDEGSCAGLAPVGYWSFDVYDGVVFEEQTGGELSDAIPNEKLPLVEGRFGNAVSLDGEDDYVAIQHADALLLEQGTISIWVQPARGASGGIVSKDASGTAIGGHIGFSIGDEGEIGYRLQNTEESHHANSLQTVTPLEWNHVVVTFGPRGMEIYLHGVKQGSNDYRKGIYDPMSAGTQLIENTEPIAVGAATSGSNKGKLFPIRNHLFAEVDELAIFDRQLSQDEIDALAEDDCYLGP